MDPEPQPRPRPDPPAASDALWVQPVPMPRRVALSPADVEHERLAGFPTLDAIQRQLAIEFVISGATLKALADTLDLSLPMIRRLMADPILRAFISDLQKEMAVHRLINEQWVEAQILKNLPKFEGEEPIPVVTRDGDQVMRNKFHSKELVALYKAFGGNADQKKNGGVHVTIDFGSMGVSMPDDSHVIDVP
jgi:hypothetical protein